MLKKAEDYGASQEGKAYVALAKIWAADMAGATQCNATDCTKLFHQTIHVLSARLCKMMRYTKSRSLLFPKIPWRMEMLFGDANTLNTSGRTPGRLPLLWEWPVSPRGVSEIDEPNFLLVSDAVWRCGRWTHTPNTLTRRLLCHILFFYVACLCCAFLVNCSKGRSPWY